MQKKLVFNFAKKKIKILIYLCNLNNRVLTKRKIKNVLHNIVLAN